MSRSHSSSDSEVAPLVRSNTRSMRRPSNEASSSRPVRASIPELTEIPIRDGRNNAAAAMETGESSNPVRSEGEDRFAAPGVFLNDIQPTLDHRGQIGGIPTSSTVSSINEMLDVCGLGRSGVNILIPHETQRPWTPPKGYICLYEMYFTRCRLRFPLPELLFQYTHRRKLAISQLAPASICNIVGVLTLASEVGTRVPVMCFEEMTVLKKSRVAGNFTVNMREKQNVIPGTRVSNFKGWEKRFFYVRADYLSLENPFVGLRRRWNSDPDRIRNFSTFPPEYSDIVASLFSGENRAWDQFSRKRVEEAMGRIPRKYPNFAEELAKSSGTSVTALRAQDAELATPSTTAMEVAVVESAAGGEVAPTDLPIVDLEGDGGDEVEVPGQEVVTAEQEVARSEGDAAGRKKKKKRIDKGKGVALDSSDQSSRKRSAEAADLESSDPFRLTRKDSKTDKFCFDYFGESSVAGDRYALAELCRNLKFSSEILPDLDALEFKEDYLNYSRFALQSIAYGNALFFKYEKRMKSRSTANHAFLMMEKCAKEAQDKVAMLRKQVGGLEEQAKVHEGVIASLEDTIADLRAKNATLDAEKAKAEGDLQSLQEFCDSECWRLRLDRQAVVERTRKKAQDRLDRVKAFLAEQEVTVRPKEDLLNQALGVEATIDRLVKECHAQITEEEIAKIKAKKIECKEVADALDYLVLDSADLNMSPDQLGYGLLRPEDPAPRSIREPHGSNAAAFQADLRAPDTNDDPPSDPGNPEDDVEVV
ncbi:meiosis-specific protein ASY2-like [Capsella rubella]|uniref:meiosis-specific protein ASY2-like n=1 Tax=Capsella rubella TaxID=81985 RepID=UPI000CD5B3AD|nr:meiosis-specific protein ASY2-like [Capsella rubella]